MAPQNITPEQLDRIDALLSAAMDGEATPEEQAELAALRDGFADGAREGAENASPDWAAIVAERARLFGLAEAALRNLAQSASPSSVRAGTDADSDPAAGLASLRSRIAEEEGRPAARSRRMGWAVPLAAAAALALYWATGSDGPGPEGPSQGATQERMAESAQPFSPPAGAAEGPLAEEDALVELALLFELEDERGEAPLEAGDLEIIEQLELLEFLAARGGEGQG